MENIKVDEYKRLSIEIQNVFITFVISQQYLKNKMVQNTNAVKRLVSLDVLRGLTVMFMIFVNNGAGEEIFSTLQHSKWNGMTPCDLVFPFFLFIMGISTYLSLRKGGFRWTHQQARKTVKRTLLLFLIGLLINWFDMAMDGRPLDFAHLRIMGVMQRIAICYGATVAAVLTIHHLTHSFRGLWILVALLLTGYSILLIAGGGYDYDSSTNILSRVDHALLGDAHLYHKSPVDPEGLLSSFSAMTNTMIGFLVASWALRKEQSELGHPHLVTLSRLLVCGAALSLVGWLLQFGLPLNKRVWSPSYVLLTCGIAASLQGLLVGWLDIYRAAQQMADSDSAGQPWFVRLTLWFGMNPLFLYVASEAIGIFFGAVGVKSGAYALLHAVIVNGYWASVAYATLFVALHALMGWTLWKKQVFIKL